MGGRLGLTNTKVGNTNTKVGNTNTKVGNTNTYLTMLCIYSKIILSFHIGVFIMRDMKLVRIKDNKNNLVVKHKDLVWEARYRLSELGIKIVSMLISMIKVNDDEFHQYALKVDDFKELIGSNSKETYKYTHKLIKELLSKTLKIGDKQFAWISFGEYIEGNDIMIFEISRHLKPYLLALQGDFLEYNIVNILPLKSTYVIRLYELFKSKWKEYKYYHPNAKSYQFDIKIDWLREHFEIPASYQYSSGIKLRIIDKAQKQFKEKTDIQFDYKEQKIGRKVDRLIITVKDNNKGSADNFATLQKFIDWARKEYMPDPANNKFPKFFEYQEVSIGVDFEGKLWIAIPDQMPITPDKNRAKIIWELLYRYFKKEIDEAEVLHTIFYQEEEQQQQIEEKEEENIQTEQEEVNKCDNKTALENINKILNKLKTV